MPSSEQQQAARHETIRSIIESESVANQAVLQEKLRNHGYDVTQSCVSRDLHRLGVIKIDGRYQMPFGSTERESLSSIRQVTYLINSIVPAGPNLIVIKTVIGGAQRVAVCIDSLNWSEVVGTVAGDDTILVAVTSAAKQAVVLAKLNHARADA